MMRIGVVGLTLCLAGCGATLQFATSPVGDFPAHLAAASPEAAASALSAYRRQRGLPEVRPDASLTRVAEHQATAMARTGVFSHEADGAFPARLGRFGVRHRAAAENLSAGSASLAEVLRRWRASPDHDANLLLPGATRIGFAQAVSERTRLKRYWVLVLAD